MGRRKFPNSHKSLLHFDFPYVGEANSGLRDEIGIEGWSAQGNTKFVGTELPNDEVVAGTPWAGYRCPQFAGTGDYLSCGNLSGMWNLSSEGNYEAEMFVRPTTATAGNILVVGDMTLGLNASRQLTLASATLGLSITSTGTLTLNVFNHIVLRFAGGTAYLFIGGQASGSQAMTASASLSPTEARLGGFTGQVDEFCFRHSAGVGAPSVPTSPYTGMLDIKSVSGFGDGHYGDQVVNTPDTQINAYGMIASVNALNANSVTLASNFNVGIFGAPTAGDDVMVHVSAMKGSVQDDIGKYAIRRLTSVAGTTLTFDNGISEEFGLGATLLSNYYVQVISIPQFRNFDIQAAGVVVPHTWDTTYGGGIVAFKCNGTFNINGKIITQCTGPVRTDTLTLTHADIINRFINSGNAFIMASNITGSDTGRIGGPQDGSLKGGGGGSYGNTPTGGSWLKGEAGSAGKVGVGGPSGYGAKTNYSYRGLGGMPGEGGKGGTTIGGGQLNGSASLLGSPNVIIIAQHMQLSNKVISTGGTGGGGGGAGGHNGNSTDRGGGGGGGNGGAGGTGFPATQRGGAGGGASNTSNGKGEDCPSRTLAHGGAAGGTAGGSGYGGGGGGGGDAINTVINAEGGAGTGFAYIAVTNLEEVA